MIPVTLSTPESTWEISISISSLPFIRALVNTSADHTKTGTITTTQESFQDVPVSAIQFLDRCYRAGVLF